MPSIHTRPNPNTAAPVLAGEFLAQFHAEADDAERRQVESLILALGQLVHEGDTVRWGSLDPDELLLRVGHLCRSRHHEERVLIDLVAFYTFLASRGVVGPLDAQEIVETLGERADEHPVLAGLCRAALDAIEALAPFGGAAGPSAA